MTLSLSFGRLLQDLHTTSGHRGQKEGTAIIDLLTSLWLPFKIYVGLNWFFQVVGNSVHQFNLCCYYVGTKIAFL